MPDIELLDNLTINCNSLELGTRQTRLKSKQKRESSVMQTIVSVPVQRNNATQTPIQTSLYTQWSLMAIIANRDYFFPVQVKKPTGG